MDDLDHSVLIAEQDWDCFCLESEECSVQQVELASLDESGFSDTDDDITLVYVSSVHTQSSPDQQCEGQKPYQTVECKIEHTSEKSEFNEYACPKTDNARSSEQTSNARERDPGAPCESQNEANDDCHPTEKLNFEEFRGNDEKDESKLIRDTTKPNYEHRMEGTETLTEVTDALKEAKKEKERWFVTVNDSPVRLRVKSPISVQKKRRKKKTSENLSKRKSFSVNNNTEPAKDIIEEQTMLDKLQEEKNLCQPRHIPNVKCFSPTEGEEENPISVIDLKMESVTEIPKAKLENNPTDCLNSFSTTKHTLQEIFQDLSGPSTQTTACDEYNNSALDINSDCNANNPSHFYNDSSSKTETTEPQEPSYNREESSQETQSTSAKNVDATQPIFAISSFWDEMEKMTINDILQLRIANKQSQLTESIIPEKSNPLGAIDGHSIDIGEVEAKDEDDLIDDTADSDYFTHLDDSKPYRSSCEFSTYSDFDDEFLQLLHASANPSPEPLNSKPQTQRFLESGVDLEETWRSESNESGNMCLESDAPLCMYSERETELQDMFQTFEEDNSTSTFLLNHCSTRSTPSPALSISDILDDHCLQSLFEIMKSNAESEQYQAWIPERNMSICVSQNGSVADTYNDFFSDFDIGHFSTSENALVPIYSSSHSVVKNLGFPEVEEAIQSNTQVELTPVQVIRCENPSETPNIFFMTSQKSTWRNLSLRHTKLLGRTWCRMATLWDFPKTADKVYSYGTGTTSSSSIAQPKLPVLLFEHQALGQGTEHQMQFGAKVTESDRFLFSLKQADMCLVCIAFASWVLKSSNPQSTDMWKAALLANVSAISAIQYLRQYMKEG